MKLACRLGWHRWSLWVTFARGLLMTKAIWEETERTTGQYSQQRRTCLDCGREQLRTVTTL